MAVMRCARHRSLTRIAAHAQHNLTTMAEILNLALGGVDPPFDPYVDDISFLIATYILEDVGVTAYLVSPSPRAPAAQGLQRCNRACPRRQTVYHVMSDRNRTCDGREALTVCPGAR